MIQTNKYSRTYLFICLYSIFYTVLSMLIENGDVCHCLMRD